MPASGQALWAFWDSSALVPALVRQTGSTRARQLLRIHSKPVVCWLTLVELNSALARLVREGVLKPAGRDVALRQIATLEAVWVEVSPTIEVRTLAAELPYKYNLRAADAFQLASALVWCGGRPRGRAFITLDERLAEAAQSAGFKALSYR
jgi:predicted nucleic acid-binding protein